ncbi:MAG: R3H domain-containing nucleic acid-binding protein [Patescibacteria group bacterium]
MSKEAIQKIQTLIQNLLKKMSCSGSVDFIEYPENLFFSIRANDGNILIGEDGERLRALNHIVHKIVERESYSTGEDFKFFIDVNDYQKQKIEELKDLARLSAQRVRYFKKEVEMRPMNAYERRIIHATLTEYPDISTQSTGTGIERRVVIKPL